MPHFRRNEADAGLGEMQGDKESRRSICAAMSDLHARIRRFRKAAGLSQIGLARALGISGPSVWEWENGKSKPSIERLAELAHVLGCDVADLLDTEADPYAAERANLMATVRQADRPTIVLLTEIAQRMVATQKKPPDKS